MNIRFVQDHGDRFARQSLLERVNLAPTTKRALLAGVWSVAHRAIFTIGSLGMFLLAACQEMPSEAPAPAKDEFPAGRPIGQALSSDPREAVKLEALLAVMGWDWDVDRVLGPWAAGDWNYLADDIPAYNQIKSWYYSPLGSSWSLYYSNISSYGYYGSYGRGGQCAGFANALLYRSGVYRRVLPTYAACKQDYDGSRRFTKPISKIRVGDVIRTLTTNGHTAVVVKIMAGTEGSSVTSVDVVDSNLIGNEIIGRHIISVSGTGSGPWDLDNYYAVDLLALVAN